VPDVPTYVLRVWVPDRPGALGSVASRIGAVRGDLVGIDILERGGGRAIDELVVDLPDAALVPLLLAEVGQVDGVDVEDVRPAPPSLADPRLDALETAALLVEQTDIDGLLLTLSTHARHDFEADWGIVIDPASAVPLAAVGSPPPTAWLAAFVSGIKSSVRVATGECGPDDIAWASVDTADLAVVVGRRGRPFRARERRQLAALARVASSRWAELARATTAAAVTHPISS
jgi:hypothetical protein